MLVLQIVRLVLVFVWLIPYIYLILTNYTSLERVLSVYELRVTFVFSFVASFVLFIEWFLALRNFLNINRAFKYLERGDIDKLNNIIEKISIRKCYFNDKTLLQYAVDKQMDLDIIYFLISNDALITYKSNHEYNISYTLFYISSYYENINEKIVLFFLNKGAYIDFIDNSRGFNSLSLLQVFVLRTNRKIVDLLLTKGADINYFIPDLDMNTLMLASKYINDPTIISMLIKAGADIDKANNNGYPPILFAAEFNENPEIIRTLCKFGAKIKVYKVKGQVLRINNVTPLRLAATSNNAAVVDALIELGDDVNYKDLYNLSILFIAATHNPDLQVLEVLLDNEADIDKARDNEGNTPLMGAAYLNSNVNVIKYLIKITENLGVRNNEGFSFIDYLKENRNIDEDKKQQVLNKLI